MPRENIPAGAEVEPGVYRCNACANEHECLQEGEKLPMCCVCDSISWRRSRKVSRGGSEGRADQPRQSS